MDEIVEIEYNELTLRLDKEENVYVGRTYRDAPDIDGYIFITTEEEWMTGDFVKVRITGALDYDLIGEIV